MCTAATFQTDNDTYFGRNLDVLETDNETIVIAPRNYNFKFRNVDDIDNHHAIIGMAKIIDEYPLFYEAMNEKGLAVAGLNYFGAIYKDVVDGRDNVASFEFIPWILTQCATVKEAVELIEKINITNISFNNEYPASALHWMISDKESTIVVESDQKGLMIYVNPVGVLANAPSFDKQVFNLRNYRNVSNKTLPNLFTQKMDLDIYSTGMGTSNLPGGFSSTDRFVRTAFVLHNSIQSDDELENVSQFFHILSSSQQPKGSNQVAEDKYEYTVYSSCMNIDKGIYYYKSYANLQINAVDMAEYELGSDELGVYPVLTTGQINYQKIDDDEEVMYN